jgi:hypothetical protein
MTEIFDTQGHVVEAAGSLRLNGNDQRLATLEQQVGVLAWLHAELGHKHFLLATSVATLLAQQMQPQLQQSILRKLMGGG